MQTSTAKFTEAEHKFEKQLQRDRKEIAASMADPNVHKHTKQVNKRLEAIWSDPNAQEHAERIAKQLEIALADPNVQAEIIQERVAEELEVTMADINIKKLTERIAEQTKLMLADPHVQEQAKRVVKHMPAVREHAKQVAQQVNAVMADPNMQEQADLLAEDMTNTDLSSNSLFIHPMPSTEPKKRSEAKRSLSRASAAKLLLASKSAAAFNPSSLAHGISMGRARVRHSVNSNHVSRARAAVPWKKKHRGAAAVQMALNYNISDAPPASTDEKDPSIFDQLGVASSASRGFVRFFADLRLAIAELCVLTALCVLATLLEQGQTPGFYESKYGSYASVFGSAVGGAFDAALPSPGGISVLLGFDHMFSSPVFLSLSAALGVSLATCTYSRQVPMAKAAKRWTYAKSLARFASMDSSFKVRLPGAIEVNSAASSLASRGYTVVSNTDNNGDAQGYAFKGLLGRFAPIGVHASLLMILLGSAYSALGTWRGQIFLNPGEEVAVREVLAPNTRYAGEFPGIGKKLRVDDFRIDYREDGSVKQFYSDIAIDTPGGTQREKSTTIAVNTPLRKDRLTVYQTSWRVGAMRVAVRPQATLFPDVPNEFREYELPMSEELVSRLGPGKFPASSTGGFLPLSRPANDAAAGGKSLYGVLFVADDLNQVYIFSPSGSFAGVRRPDSGKPISVAGYDIILTGLIPAAGLELKSDPGVPWVYAGFGGSMLTTAASLVPYNQVWFRQSDKDLYVGGKSNRAKDKVADEVKGVLEEVVAVAMATPRPSENASTEDMIGT